MPIEYDSDIFFGALMKLFWLSFRWGMVGTFLSAILAALCAVVAANQSSSSAYSLLAVPLFAVGSGLLAFVPSAVVAALVVAIHRGETERANGLGRVIMTFLIPVVLAAVVIPYHLLRGI